MFFFILDIQLILQFFIIKISTADAILSTDAISPTSGHFDNEIKSEYNRKTAVPSEKEVYGFFLKPTYSSYNATPYHEIPDEKNHSSSEKPSGLSEAEISTSEVNGINQSDFMKRGTIKHNPKSEPTIKLSNCRLSSPKPSSETYHENEMFGNVPTSENQNLNQDFRKNAYEKHVHWQINEEDEIKESNTHVLHGKTYESPRTKRIKGIHEKEQDQNTHYDRGMVFEDPPEKIYSNGPHYRFQMSNSEKRPYSNDDSTKNTGSLIGTSSVTQPTSLPSEPGEQERIDDSYDTSRLSHLNEYDENDLKPAGNFLSPDTQKEVNATKDAISMARKKFFEDLETPKPEKDLKWPDSFKKNPFSLERKIDQMKSIESHGSEDDDEQELYNNFDRYIHTRASKSSSYGSESSSSSHSGSGEGSATQPKNEYLRKTIRIKDSRQQQNNSHSDPYVPYRDHSPSPISLSKGRIQCVSEISSESSMSDDHDPFLDNFPFGMNKKDSSTSYIDNEAASISSYESSMDGREDKYPNPHQQFHDGHDNSEETDGIETRGHPNPSSTFHFLLSTIEVFYTEFYEGVVQNYDHIRSMPRNHFTADFEMMNSEDRPDNSTVDTKSYEQDSDHYRSIFGGSDETVYWSPTNESNSDHILDISENPFQSSETSELRRDNGGFRPPEDDMHHKTGVAPNCHQNAGYYKRNAASYQNHALKFRATQQSGSVPKSSGLSNRKPSKEGILNRIRKQIRF